MQLYSIDTYEYDANMEKLLERRLRRQGFSRDFADGSDKQRIRIVIEDSAQLKQLCGALAELLLLDLRYFEVARMVNSLPFSLREKQTVLPEALKYSLHCCNCESVCKRLYQYLSENDLLVLEGFMRFRMRDTIDAWSLSVDRAAEELLLHEEYAALMQLIGSFAQIETSDVSQARIILHPDGSSTIIGDNNMRIDCAAGNDAGVINMLIGMEPEQVTIYDLSLGKCDSLCKAIQNAFEGSCRYFD